MKLEFNVVRMDNEDVIATSCGSALAVLHFDGSNIDLGLGNPDIFSESSAASGDDKINAALKTIESTLSARMDEVAEGGAGYYHITADGKIEACDDFTKHSDWVNID